MLKDHYKTLGIAPAASPAEVKKAYRSLAFKYHPDKNQKNPFAESHFKEIQEAYAILSHSRRRIAYDEERWLSGMGNRMREQQAVTPAWVLKECTKLSAHISAIDTYRMSHTALRDYILLILSGAHMAILKEENDIETNRQVITTILNASTPLQQHYFTEIIARLRQLAGNDEIALAIIQLSDRHQRKQFRNDKYMPYIIIGITIFLCLLMYLYGRK